MFMSDNANSLTQGHAVVDFWESIGPDGWFEKNDEIDRRFREQFLAAYEAAAARQCMHWLHEARPGLGLILLLDQFPRNAFRGSPKVYATDALAREAANEFIERGHMAAIDLPLRMFVRLPFSHSEALADQDRAVALHKQYIDDDTQWADHHREIIRRFGRFPHRNAILGRTTTPDEQAFLDEGGFQG